MIQAIEFLFERKWAGGSSIWKKNSPTLPWLHFTRSEEFRTLILGKIFLAIY